MTPAGLHYVMDTNHLNVKRLASLLFVHERTVYHWLTGRNKMSLSKWEHLMLVTGPTAKTMQIGDSWSVTARN